jgi:hypothetical protein
VLRSRSPKNPRQVEVHSRLRSGWTGTNGAALAMAMTPADPIDEDEV